MNDELNPQSNNPKDILKNDVMQGNEELPTEPYYPGSDEVDEAERVFQDVPKPYGQIETPAGTNPDQPAEIQTPTTQRDAFQPEKEIRELSEITQQPREPGTFNPETGFNPQIDLPSAENINPYANKIPPKSRSELYSNLTKIIIPLVVAVIFIGAGTFAYNLLTKSDDPDAKTEETDDQALETDSLVPSGLFDESFSESLEKALEEGIDPQDETADELPEYLNTSNEEETDLTDETPEDETPEDVTPEDVTPEDVTPEDVAPEDVAPETKPKIPTIKPRS